MQLVGQPFTILSYMVLPVLRCNCEQGGIVAPMAQQRDGGMQRTNEQCPACHRTFAIATIGVAPNGALQLGIEMGIPVDQLISQ